MRLIRDIEACGGEKMILICVFASLGRDVAHVNQRSVFQLWLLLSYQHFIKVLQGAGKVVDGNLENFIQFSLA